MANPGHLRTQIWHSSHGRYETQSPVRTFVPYTIGGQTFSDRRPNAARTAGNEHCLIG